MIKLFNRTAYQRVYTLKNGEPFSIKGFTESEPMEKALLSKAILGDVESGKLAIIDLPHISSKSVKNTPNLTDTSVSGGGEIKVKGGKK